MLVRTLDELSREDPAALRRTVGGKAASLVTLVSMGLPVPPAVVLPVQALEAHLRAAGLWSRARAGDDLSALLAGTSLSAELSRDLARAVAPLGPRLAVRSSAVDEDGPTSSFAGQYLTVLGASPGAELEQAILRCWASAWSPTAAAYRKARGRGGVAAAPMAVLVQHLVEPRCAGVLFTINPATGSWREMAVEAAWGQGEAVVAGLVVPEFHRVQRPRRTPRPIQRVLARVRLHPLERVDAEQPLRWVVAPDRGVLLPQAVPAALQNEPRLSRDALLRLCRLGLRVEARMGEPADIEWAQEEGGRLWVLQARPVTAGADVRRAGPTLWTRRFVGERWTQPATPLGWSLMRELLEWFIAYPETSRRFLGGAPATRSVRFAPYFNVSLFRHLAFKAPGFAPPRFMLELLPPEEERGWLRSRAQAPDLRVYGSILSETLRERRWQRFRWNPLTNWRAWEELVPRLDAALAELAPPIDRRAEALARAEVCLGLAREYVRVHICSLLFANIWYQAAEALLQARGQAELVPDLLRAPADTATARVNRELWRLGQGTRSLDDFLARYGHRADGSWELFSDRWCEAPAHVLAMAEALRLHPDPALESAAAHERARLALDQLDPPVRAVVELSRTYLALREDQRFAFDRIAWAWKQAWTWLEQDTGLALRFLEAGEAHSVLGGTLSRQAAQALIDRRQQAWQEESLRRAQGDEPPAFLIGDAEEGVAPDAGNVLQGMGISPGVVTGPVRILRSLADAHRLRPGDVLVTRATDPAWTPLFLNASGLVMEIGGMLSHGAVVAREYRLPAVVNVRDATTRLQEGQTVTLDGSRGRVWVR